MKEILEGIAAVIFVIGMGYMFVASSKEATKHRSECVAKNGVYLETESTWICIKKDSQIRLGE